MTEQQKATEQEATLRFNWRLWWQWVIVSAGTLAVGGFAVGYMSGYARPLLNESSSIVLDVVALMALGLLLGVAQWIILRHRIEGAGWWIPATAIGISGPVSGLLVGVLQWFVLQRNVNRAGWWIVATLVGVLVAGLSGSLGGMIGSLLGPFLYSAITGTALEWLLRHPKGGRRVDFT